MKTLLVFFATTAATISFAQTAESATQKVLDETKVEITMPLNGTEQVNLNQTSEADGLLAMNLNGNPIDLLTDMESFELAANATIDAPQSLEMVGFTLKLYKATIHGTSTLHDWESKITKIDGKGLFQLTGDVFTKIQDAEIKVLVKGIKSTEGDKMDNKTYETFHADKNPYITYSFTNVFIKTSETGEVTLNASGQLSMAGTTKTAYIVATGKRLANGDLRLTVSKKLKMTDYNMEPPVMFMGAMKVGNEITVNFDFELIQVNN
ncbi:MAG: YceI family protein [Crocinitomicaceae bacterium]